MTRPQEIRKEILLQLYAARPVSLSSALIARQAKKAGLDYSADEVKRECAFLQGLDLIAGMNDPVSGEVRFAITSNGVLAHENE